MSLHDDLLALAYRLNSLDRRRPRQATLRRSVSTSYYAIFHCLTAGAVGIVGQALQPSAAAQVQRWFDHREMKRVAVMFSSAAFPKQMAALLGAAPSADLQQLAQSFIRLQDARHSADYDLHSQWTRNIAQAHARRAQDATEAWNRIQRSHEANLFALALLSPRLFDRDR